VPGRSYHACSRARCAFPLRTRSGGRFPAQRGENCHRGAQTCRVLREIRCPTTNIRQRSRKHMPTPVKMPRLGESVAEGTIGGWLKNEGDWVEKDESLAEVITDKITADLPSPVEGRLVKILTRTDETVPVG